MPPCSWCSPWHLGRPGRRPRTPGEARVTAASHVPVLLERVLELLAPSFAHDRPVVVDATLGLGGHAEAMLTRFDDLHLIGIDRDPEALARAGRRLESFGDRVTLAHAVYDEIADVVRDAGFDGRVRRAVRPRGVLDAARPHRARLRLCPGRAARHAHGPRRRHDRGRRPQHLRRRRPRPHAVRCTARSASPVASPSAIVAARADEPFTTSARLVDLIRASIPAAARRTGGNPAKRTFQALRIEVNDELGAYERALPAALDVVEPGGRVVVLAYHSLEDRLTKRAFARVTTTDVPRDVPFVPEGHEPAFRLLTRGRGAGVRGRDRDQPARPLGAAACCGTSGGMNAAVRAKRGRQ